MKAPLLIGLTASLTLIASSASAADKHAFNDAESAVDYRQSALSIMRDNFVAMAAMVKGEVAYDAEVFEQRANDFSRLAHIPWAGFRVEGAMPGNDTDALPEIWDNWDDFKSRSENFVADAEQLAKVANSQSMEEIKPIFMQTAKNCKGCHDNYKD